MNFFKRALISLKRHPIKNGVLLFLILILTTALSGAISTRQAIIAIDESLMLRLPPVSTVYLNAAAVAEERGIEFHELDSDFWSAPRPTVDDISTVGSLPYVRAYDSMMISYLASLELDSVGGGSRDEFNPVEFFTGYGIANPHLTDIDTNLIELVHGRTFTQEDIENNEHAIIVSQLFAETNSLSVGSLVEFENNVYNYAKFSLAQAQEGIEDFSTIWRDERFLLAQEIIELEVVGIFNPLLETDLDVLEASDDWETLSHLISLLNRIYMPISVAESLQLFKDEAMLSILEEFLEVFPQYSEGESMSLNLDEPQLETIFVLYHPRYLERFAEAGSELLPGYWGIGDLQVVNEMISTSMETMTELADLVLLGAAGAAIAILTLVITLFTRDRQREIGIYMALGEKKGKIISQLLIEVFLVTIIAATFSLFIGRAISSTLSRTLLEQNLTERFSQESEEFAFVSIPWELAVFNPGSMLIEDTLDMYDTSLGINTIIGISGVGTIVILLSTIIPIVYILRLKPIKVLM